MNWNVLYIQEESLVFGKIHLSQSILGTVLCFLSYLSHDFWQATPDTTKRRTSETRTLEIPGATQSPPSLPVHVSSNLGSSPCQHHECAEWQLRVFLFASSRQAPE